MALVNEHGESWSDIAKAFGGKKTDNQCKRRWRFLKKKELDRAGLYVAKRGRKRKP